MDYNFFETLEACFERLDGAVFSDLDSISIAVADRYGALAVYLYEDEPEIMISEKQGSDMFWLPVPKGNRGSIHDAFDLLMQLPQYKDAILPRD